MPDTPLEVVPGNVEQEAPVLGGKTGQELPFIVKHMALAVYFSKYTRGTKLERILWSVDIARSRLREYGYLRVGSDRGPSSNIRLTSKGLRRERQHMTERGGRRKNALFDRLYRQVSLAEAAMGGENSSTGAGDEQGQDRPDPRQRFLRLKQRARTLIRAARSGPAKNPHKARKTRIASAARPKRAKRARVRHARKSKAFTRKKW